MALPVVKYPTFMITIPSTQETVKFRPFTVAEEKILLMANEAGDMDSITNAIVEVLNVCFFEKVDVKNLPSFDIEFMFLSIRSKSVSEQIELIFRNQNCPEENGNPCKKSAKVTIDIADIKVQKLKDDGSYGIFKPENVSKMGTKILISDDMGVTMIYPNMEAITSANKKDKPIDQMEDLVCSSITSVFDEENVYTDFSKKEMIEWFNSLLSNQKDKLLDFVKNIPLLRYEMNYKCSKCGYEETLTFEGLQSFL